MNMTNIKKTLETIGYPVKGDDAFAVLGDLHTNYSSTKVGSSIAGLGDAAPLYVLSGNVAHLVDNPHDLQRACSQIDALLKQRKGAKPIVLQPEVRSPYLPDILRAVENAVDDAEKYKRNTPITADQYSVKYDPSIRKQTRKGEQIINDLLSSNAKRQSTGLKALRDVLVY